VLDEAYYEFGAFAGEPGAWTAAPLVAEHGRLVVLRTFSKLFGLAGLRVGYAICPPEIAAGLRERKQPFNVNRAGLVAAQAALDDADWLAERARAIVAERERMARALAGLPGLRVFPSAANFLLMETLNGAAQPLWEALLDRGIMLRRFSSERQARYLRVTSGTPEENDRFLAALTEIMTGSDTSHAREGGRA
jgi:histidinol-phosphate aminotransferase